MIVVVSIKGTEYNFVCNDSDGERLKKAALQLEERFESIAMPRDNKSQLLLMVALGLQDELSCLHERLKVILKQMEKLQQVLDDTTEICS